MAPTDIVRRLLPYMTAAVIAAAIYTGSVMYRRYAATRQVQQRREEKARDRTIEAGRQIERQFGDELKILNFAADKNVTSAGGRVLLCYGVANAATVKIEPEIEPLKPAVSRCIETFPKQTTTYTLTAVDAKDHVLRAMLTVRVSQE